MALSKIKRIAPLSAALVVGLINAAIGFLAGVLSFALSIFLARNPDFASALAQSGMQNMLVSSVSGSAWLLLLYPATGFISSFIAAIAVVWLYNLIARKVQVRLEIK